MKNLFFSFILLLAVTGAYAQRSVNFVSFFPPVHVNHKTVTLEQNVNSFSTANAAGLVSSNDYLNKIGGLVLGAASSSTIRVNTLKIDGPSSYAIRDFHVDNVIKVTSRKGAIGNMEIGAGGDTAVGISANEYGMLFGDYGTTKVVVFVGGLATLKKNRTINGFPPAFGTSTLTWRTVRIDGTEECRRYLFKGTAPTDNTCRETNSDPI